MYLAVLLSRPSTHFEHRGQVLCAAGQLPEGKVPLLEGVDLFLSSPQSLMELRTHRDKVTLTEDT